MNQKKELLKAKTVLLIAYACEPNKGSEPGVGWEWVKIISEIVGKVYVLTRKNNRKSIELEAKKIPSNIEFIYYDLPKLLRFWKKGSRGVRTYYYLWQIGGLLYIKKLLKKKLINFDIVHHVTFVNDWLPSFFVNLNKPFIWGPIGSNNKFPVFLFERFIDFIQDRIRIFLQWLFRNFDPNFRKTVKKSSVIIGINDSVKKKIKLKELSKFYVIPAIGLDKFENIYFDSFDISKNLKILSVGRFIYIKNFPLTIRIFKRLNQIIPNSELWLIGTGQQKKFLKNLVNELNLTEKVKFLGWVQHKKVFELMKNADLFLFPSLEDGGMVVLEAMKFGLPVFCLNSGGPGKFQPCENFKTNLNKLNKEFIIEDLVKKIVKFVKNSGNYKDCEQSILRHLTNEKILFSSKKKELIKIYSKVLSEED